MIECTKCKITSENFTAGKTRCRDCNNADSNKRRKDPKQKQKEKEINARYYRKNMQHVKTNTKAYKESKKLGYYVVYHLPNEHYCGVTQNTYHRMLDHKHRGNDTTDWVVIHKCETKAGALAIEAQYHAKGWLGASGYKNTLQNLLSCDT